MAADPSRMTSKARSLGDRTPRRSNRLNHPADRLQALRTAGLKIKHPLVAIAVDAQGNHHAVLPAHKHAINHQRQPIAVLERAFAHQLQLLTALLRPHARDRAFTDVALACPLQSSLRHALGHVRHNVLEQSCLTCRRPITLQFDLAFAGVPDPWTNNLFLASVQISAALLRAGPPILAPGFRMIAPPAQRLHLLGHHRPERLAHRRTHHCIKQLGCFSLSALHKCGLQFFMFHRGGWFFWFDHLPRFCAGEPTSTSLF